MIQKNKKIKYFIVVVIILMVVFFLKSCKGNIQDFKEMDETTFESPLVYTKSAGHYYDREMLTITEGGLFYYSNHLLRFLNFEDFKRYTLCFEVACLHNNENCSAWYETHDDIQCMAVHNQKLYAFIKNKNKNTYDLTEMNLMAQNERLLHLFRLESL